MYDGDWPARGTAAVYILFAIPFRDDDGGGGGAGSDGEGGAERERCVNSVTIVCGRVNLVVDM